MTLAEKRIIQGEIKRLKGSGCASPLSVLDDLDAFVENLAEESVEPDFQKHAEIWLNYFVERNDSVKRKLVYETAKEFAKWQREHLGPTIEGFVARDGGKGDLYFYNEKPELDKKWGDMYHPEIDYHGSCLILERGKLINEILPDVDINSGPVEVKLVIIEKS